MKYTLETEDKEEFETAYHGHKYKFIIEELRNWIRSELKYNTNISPLVAKTLENVRQKLLEIERENFDD